MSSSSPGDPIAALEPLIRRIVSSRVTRTDDADDLVQETLTRLYEAQDRLELHTLASYAAITARNLLVSSERSRQSQQRHTWALYDPRRPIDPEERALRLEEREAMAVALAHLRDEEREMLLQKDVLGMPTTSIARDRSITPGAAATRLARTRARLRVEFLLVFRRIDLPTPRCRPVLYAIAAGDTARQGEARAGSHLEECETCASLVVPLIARKRSLAALAPVAFASQRMRSLRSWARAHPTAATSSVAILGAGIAAVVVLSGPSSETTSPPRSERHSVLTIGGTAALPLPRAFSWESHAGEAAVARAAPVQSVPIDEGFWIGTDDSRVFVIITGQAESRIVVSPGDRVWFTGLVVANARAAVHDLGLRNAEGKGLLATQGHHIEVKITNLRDSPPS